MKKTLILKCAKILKLRLSTSARKLVEIYVIIKCIFIFSELARFSSTSPKADLKVNKDLLSKLRKDTGYPFSKCHDALRASSNEMTGALEWLEEMSQKEGWKKAEKLKGRLTGQGLIGAIVQDNVAALVEVRFFKLDNFKFDKKYNMM